MGANNRARAEQGNAIRRAGVVIDARRGRAWAMLGDSRDTTAWAYVDKDAGAMLLIAVAKGSGATQPRFEAFYRGTRDGFMRPLRAQLGEGVEVKAIEDEVDWQARTGRLHLQIGADAHVHLRCWAGRFGSACQAAVAVVTFTRDGDGLADVVASFERD